MKILISIAAFALSLILTLAISSGETVSAQSNSGNDLKGNNLKAESIFESQYEFDNNSGISDLLEDDSNIELNIFDDFLEEAPELSFD